MLPAKSDRDLICACLAEEPRAWEMLIERYERLLWSITRRWNLSEEDSADVFQTVCVRLVENLSHLRRQESLAAWLIATTTHEVWRVLRQRSRLLTWRAEAVEGIEADLPADQPAPGDVVLHIEEEQMVRQAIQQLGGRCRVLIELLYYSEPAPSYAQIAQQLGMREGSVGPTRARCLERLGKILREMGF